MPQSSYVPQIPCQTIEFRTQARRREWERACWRGLPGLPSLSGLGARRNIVCQQADRVASDMLHCDVRNGQKIAAFGATKCNRTRRPESAIRIASIGFTQE